MTTRHVILAPRPRTPRAEPPKAAGSQSLERGLDILEMIAAEGVDVGVRELARRSGLSPTIVQRLVSSLASRGYIEKSSETQRYRLGRDPSCERGLALFGWKGAYGCGLCQTAVPCEDRNPTED